MVILVNPFDYLASATDNKIKKMCLLTLVVKRHCVTLLNCISKKICCYFIFIDYQKIGKLSR